MAQFGYELSGIEAQWPKMLRLFAADDKLTGFFRQWLLKGEGIQAFPADPLDPSTWGENRQQNKEEVRA
jgi:hypothetical protein